MLLVSLLMLAAVAAGVRVPGAPLARALADRMLCAASLADGCGDEPALIAAYGSEVGGWCAGTCRCSPSSGARGRCRSTSAAAASASCGDAAGEGLVHRTDERLPVTAFVHVVDCREEEAERTEAAGADCSGERAGNLYVQYWTYYADSATLRGVPIAGEKGYHHDDWESVQFRFRPDGSVDQRASSHHGYNYFLSDANWSSDAGLVASRRLGPGDPPPPRLRRQPRRQRRRHAPTPTASPRAAAST